jgi:hypothetical protein
MGRIWILKSNFKTIVENQLAPRILNDKIR